MSPQSRMPIVMRVVNPAGCRRPEVHDNQDHRTSRRVSTILPFGLFTRPRSVGLDVSQRQTQCALLTPLARSPSKARRGGMRQRLRQSGGARRTAGITHPGDRSRQYRRGWNTSRERQGEKIFSARPRSGPSQSRQVRRSLGQMDLSIRKLTHRFQIETIDRTTRSGRLADVRGLCPFYAGNGRPRRQRTCSSGVGRSHWEASSTNDLSISSTVCTRQ